MKIGKLLKKVGKAALPIAVAVGTQMATEAVAKRMTPREPRDPRLPRE